MTTHSVEIYTGSGGCWDDFVESRPDATAYHLFHWKGIVEESFGHKGFYLAARDRKGEITGILPLFHMKSRLFGSFIVSLPFFNYGGLLCAEEGAAHSLLAAARSLLAETGSQHVELRHLGWSFEGLPTRSHKVTMVLELANDEEVQWRRFDAKLRNQVRKAMRSGLTVATGGLDLLDPFYDVFARNMRDLGTPVYGKNFFRTVLSALSGSTCVIAVSHEGKVVAAGIGSWFRDTFEIPWASSIRDYKQFCPNNLLYWEAIRIAINDGFSRFDFGRSTPGEGTYRFKEQWGAKPHPLHWQYLMSEEGPLPEINPKNPKYQAAIGLWQKLPVALTRLVGPRIVRSIP